MCVLPSLVNVCPVWNRLVEETSGGILLLVVSLFARRLGTLFMVSPTPALSPAATHHTVCTGVTVPLLTTSSGAKVGKSAGNAVWLSGSSYSLYQAMLQESDHNMATMLRYFTFLPLEEVSYIMDQHTVSPPRTKISPPGLFS